MKVNSILDKTQLLDLRLKYKNQLKTKLRNVEFVLTNGG